MSEEVQELLAAAAAAACGAAVVTGCMLPTFAAVGWMFATAC